MESRKLQTKFSRRNLVLGAASLAATLLASCRGFSGQAATTISSATPTSVQPAEAAAKKFIATQVPTPIPVSSPTSSSTPVPAPEVINVWIDPSSPKRFRPAAERLIARVAAQMSAGSIDIERVQASTDADLRFSTSTKSNSSTSVPLDRTYLVPVCSPRISVRTVNSNQVMAMLNGAMTDWSSAGSPTSVAVQPFVIDGLRVPGTSSGAMSVDRYEDLITRFDEHPGAIALAALDDVDFRVSTLEVDGLDLLSAVDAPDTWPFTMVLYVTGQNDAWRFVEELVATAANDASAMPAPPPLTVTFVGDVILGRTVHTIMTRLNDFAAPFRLVANELKKTDLTIANLECSLSDAITPPADPYTFSFMTFTAGADGLTLSGVDAVSQANNHSMNFGAQGMRDTLTALDTRKIRHFGIGENLPSARQPVILEAQHRKIAFLGYDGITGTTYGATESSAGTCPLDADLMAEDIAAARRKADIVIPFVHWGIEYQLVPSASQQQIARTAIDAGADMVVGSHCHWVQGMEIYEGKPIIYSLANFVFDQDWSLETKQGLIMHLVFRENRLVAIRFVPVLIENFYRPRIVDGTQKTQILNRIWESTDLIRATL